MPDPLDNFAPPVAAWFRETFGQPTPPQAAGWPAIQRGEHTLILAPTGSGKTIAAFLWGIDQIYRALADGSAGAGVRLLYVSPLKALNNDIERNLRAPLAGIHAEARRMGLAWPGIRVAVRTGDTPGQARAQMVKQPPHILITTPESLYLILTSPRARDMLRTVHTVIVDEIHTLCGNKRGVHVALTLERLERLVAESARPDQGEETGPEAGPGVQRIGLSATQRPLEEVARFLGGQSWQAAVDEGTSSGDAVTPSPPHPVTLSPRPVTIVDTGYRKPLDLKVVTVVEDFGKMPGNTIWPSVIARLLGDIRRHRTTLVFVNNRRLAERTSDRLNAQLAAEETEEIPPGSTEALAPGGIVRDRGMFALGASGPIRAHHGSMSKDARRQMEEDLKTGRLPALVGTSSLELGIDIGTVDLVVQLQSPKSVSQGLQRVGRSGHLVGQVSVGRIYPTFREDLAEAAAIAHGMLNGEIEETYTPRNPLDVLAQQIVAMVAVEPWQVDDLYDLVRQAYPYSELSRRALESVLEMLAGKYYLALLGGNALSPSGGLTPNPPPPAGDVPEERGEQEMRGPANAALRARLSWDRVNGRLSALPGTRLLAVSNAGTIPDTGAYAIYLSDGATRLGEVDEEFVFETRPGDAFLFGSQVWRVLDIQDDRLVVSPAPGVTPRMPFWNGDYPWRPYELGTRIGAFRREIVERVEEIRDWNLEIAESESSAQDSGLNPDVQSLISNLQSPISSLESWLSREYALDRNSIRNLVGYVESQIDAIGVMSSDRTIVAEFFKDEVGDQRLVLHSPFGGRVNGAWATALRSLLRERLGTEPELIANDDGIIFRFPQMAGPPPVDLVLGMTPAEARERIIRELPDTAAFGAQFRMAAGRALLLPRAHGRRRTPFWLQRLKAKDLLAIVRRFGDFPIVAEAYRTCLQDVLDLVHLEEVLAGIQAGDIQVVPVETAVPSPIASALLFYFTNQYMYEWDVPKAERDLQALALRRETLAELLPERSDLSDLLRPEAVAAVLAEIGHRAPGYQARTAEELDVYMQELGDLTPPEVAAICAAPAAQAAEPPAAAEGSWLDQLAAAGRTLLVRIPSRAEPDPRWLAAELADLYAQAFPQIGSAAPGSPQSSGAGSRAAGEPTGAATQDSERAAPSPEPGASQPVDEGRPSGEARPPDLPAGPAAGPAEAAAEAVLRRYLRRAGPVTRAAILDRYAFDGGWLDRALAGLVEQRALVKGRFTNPEGDRHVLSTGSRSALRVPGTWADETFRTGAETAAGAQAEAARTGRPGPDAETLPDQYCDAAVLEQIRRRTMAQLRREIEPVPLAAYAAFLARWQHVGAGAGPALGAGAEATSRGEAALRQALGQLRGVALPLETWETAVLPARVSGFSVGQLAALCRGGELVWAGAGGDLRRLRVRFFSRGEGSLFLPPPPDDESGLSPEARAVRDFLREEGASFTADLEAGLGLRGPALARALAELAAAGLATNDSLSALHGVTGLGAPRDGGDALAGGPGAASGPGAGESARRPLSALEADLAERLAGRPRSLTHTRYQEARRRINRRQLRGGLGVQGGLPAGGSPAAATPAAQETRFPADWTAGRWSLVYRAGVLGPALSPDERALRQARALLARYGLVSREMLDHEDGPYEWGALYRALQRLELRGEVRRGYFVAGLSGAQFALPDTVEGLRAAADGTGDSPVVMNAADPANFYGGDLGREEPAGRAGSSRANAGAGEGAGSGAGPGAGGMPDGGPRFSRVPSTDLVLWRGRPLLIAEDRGSRLTGAEGVPLELLARGLAAYLDRPGAPRHVVVSQWNGGPVWGSPGESLLKSLGFYRSPAGMEWWAAP